MHGLSLVVNRNRVLILILGSLILLTVTQIKITSAQTGVVDIDARVPGCGDGYLDAGEECDLSQLGGSSCQLLGFDTGTVTCTLTCLLNTTACVMNPFTNDVGSGNGGSSSQTNFGSLVITGRAFPFAFVQILKDGQLVREVTADSYGYFQATVSSLTSGRYMFSFIARDNSFTQSTLVTFETNIRNGMVAKIYNVLLPPTIQRTESVVTINESFNVMGKTIPFNQLEVEVSTKEKTYTVMATSDRAGLYTVTIQPISEAGNVTLRARTIVSGQKSDYGAPLVVSVLNENKTQLPPLSTRCVKVADITGDCRVNIADFMVTKLWYGLPLSIEMLAREAEYFDNNGTINLFDFSLMAYYWTG
jgi:hypothetical protein